MKTSIAKVVILLFTIVGSTQAWACICEAQGTITESVETSDIVLSGRVLSKTVTKNYKNLGIKATDSTSEDSSFPQYLVFYKIKIDKILKGKRISNTIILYTLEGYEACQAEFETGEKYIIYANTSDRLIFTQEPKNGTLDPRIICTNACIRKTPWSKEAQSEENEIIHLVKKLK